WRLRAILKPPVTLGARCLVEDGAGRIVLVRHTYTPGWHFPGGAVDPGESAAEAASRELVEETGLQLDDQPVLVSLYFNRALARRDHVALFAWRLGEPVDDAELSAPAHEIAQVGLFAADALPQDVSGSVKRRLSERAGEVPVSAHW
ncbi:MAG: NUDIX domain-containing protein, partial [Pseudomonadota bacterium]